MLLLDTLVYASLWQQKSSILAIRVTASNVVPMPSAMQIYTALFNVVVDRVSQLLPRLDS